jgi:hypothetical protein
VGPAAAAVSTKAERDAQDVRDAMRALDKAQATLMFSDPYALAVGAAAGATVVAAVAAAAEMWRRQRRREVSEEGAALLVPSATEGADTV